MLLPISETNLCESKVQSKLVNCICLECR